MAPPAPGHLRAEGLVAPKSDIPAPVTATVSLPRPKAAAKAESYSVSVRNIPVQDLLFALARDAKLNVDIHPGINGVVTLNAIDQTLQQILSRISKQLDMRWEIDGPNLIVMPDSPFLRSYKVDYVNMSRDTTSTVTVSSQISTGGIAGVSGGSSGSNNNSESKIENKANNRFWETLEKNIKDILRETDKILPEGSSDTVIERTDQQTTSGTGAQGGPASNRTAAAAAGLAGSPNAASLQQQGTTVVKRATFREAASVMANPEAGVINVRATARQHEKVREFLDQVMTAAKRQVLIEATIAEVELSDNYEQGIEWARIASGIAGLAGGSGGTGIAISQAASGLFTLTGQYTSSSGGTFDGTIKLLQEYGNVKVLSSPKLSVLNNQTAMLRVVTNDVYFTVKSDVAAGVNSAPVKAVTTTPHTVAVGFVMAVTPQISSSNAITLNIRPSITSKVGQGVKDPNPDLTIDSFIPVVRTREMESVLRVESGNIVVMGGLMEDRLDNNNAGLPALSFMPLVGPLFQNRTDTRRKTELVIFLRPVIIKDASIQGDYSEYRSLLPGQNFFEKDNLGPPRQQLDLRGNPQ